MRMPRWSSRFAGGLTACRWRSSSRQLASRCWGSKALPPVWTTACWWGRDAAQPCRGTTLRAVVDWSFGLLSEDEQLFFRALGIFAGGFTVEAAAAVAIDTANTRVDAI